MAMKIRLRARFWKTALKEELNGFKKYLNKSSAKFKITTTINEFKIVGELTWIKYGLKCITLQRRY